MCSSGGLSLLALLGFFWFVLDFFVCVFCFARNCLYNWYKLIDGRLFVCVVFFHCMGPVSEWVQEQTELKHLS